MVSFESDYIAGAHPAVLRRLAETNLECLPGYGADPYCERAAQKIRALCGSPAADVYFLTGGTQSIRSFSMQCSSRFKACWRQRRGM